MSVTNQARIDRFELPHPSGEGHFQISVWANEMQPGEDVAVLFVTDADFLFATAAEITRLYGVGGMFPGAMVVGIGYGTDDLMAFTRLRTADLTPPLDDAGRERFDHMPALLGEKNGGADALLGFIIDTLRPEIARRYPKASTTNQALFGHSLGGLFTTHALLTRPEAFATFLIGSAALWWNGFSTLSLLPGFPAKVAALARKPRVFIGVGGTEQDLPTEVPAGSPMSLAQMHELILAYRVVDGSSDLAATLRDAGLDDVAFASFDGEEHITVLPALLMRALRAFVPRPA
jgi:predicted alpha/beta superfamily hydrolase